MLCDLKITQTTRKQHNQKKPPKNIYYSGVLKLCQYSKVQKVFRKQKNLNETF